MVGEGATTLGRMLQTEPPTPDPADALDGVAELVEACGDDPGGVCKWVYDRTDNETLAELAGWAIDRPLRILFIVVGAWIIKRIIQRSILHFRDRLVADAGNKRLGELRRNAAGRLLVDENVDARTSARIGTISTVLSSMAAVVIWTIAALLILGELGISLAPLLAGAGIAGVALGFGAQTIVRDFLTGFFMLVEDQFGVGDVVDVGPVTATVERVSLRATVLRDVNGNVWHVPNGEITRVGNLSQLWSRAVLDIEVAYDTDLRLAQGIIQRVADDLWRDDTFEGGSIIAPPEVWGIERLGADGIAIRLVVKTPPAKQWVVARELRLRIKEAFDEAGVEIPFPQRTVWVNQGEPPERPHPSTVRVAPVRRSPDTVEPDADVDATAPVESPADDPRG